MLINFFQVKTSVSFHVSMPFPSIILVKRGNRTLNGFHARESARTRFRELELQGRQGLPTTDSILRFQPFFVCFNYAPCHLVSFCFIQFSSFVDPSLSSRNTQLPSFIEIYHFWRSLAFSFFFFYLIRQSESGSASFPREENVSRHTSFHKLLTRISTQPWRIVRDFPYYHVYVADLINWIWRSSNIYLASIILVTTNYCEIKFFEDSNDIIYIIK